MQYHNDLTVELLQQLIRIPSENNGVTGYENDVQVFYADWLTQHGIEAQLIYPENIPGFDQLPGRLLEHSMRNRPIVIASLKGNRPGIKRLFLAHADTVSVGDLSGWDDSPFSGKIENGNIYGRGSSDDKWGLAVRAQTKRYTWMAAPIRHCGHVVSAADSVMYSVTIMKKSQKF